MLKKILSGVVIGVANVIPGVSGGTMMVAMGIYDKLISAITGLFKEFKKSFTFLLPIGIGMALGIVVLSKIIALMFDYLPFQTNCLFIGLIVGIIMLVMFMSCFSQASFVITYYILAAIGFAVFGVLIYFIIKAIFKMK